MSARKHARPQAGDLKQHFDEADLPAENPRVDAPMPMGTFKSAQKRLAGELKDKIEIVLEHRPGLKLNKAYREVMKAMGDTYGLSGAQRQQITLMLLNTWERGAELAGMLRRLPKTLIEATSLRSAHSGAAAMREMLRHDEAPLTVGDMLPEPDDAVAFYRPRAEI